MCLGCTYFCRVFSFFVPIVKAKLKLKICSGRFLLVHLHKYSRKNCGAYEVSKLLIISKIRKRWTISVKLLSKISETTSHCCRFANSSEAFRQGHCGLQAHQGQSDGKEAAEVRPLFSCISLSDNGCRCRCRRTRSHRPRRFGSYRKAHSP